MIATWALGLSLCLAAAARAPSSVTGTLCTDLNGVLNESIACVLAADGRTGVYALRVDGAGERARLMEGPGPPC